MIDYSVKAYLKQSGSSPNVYYGGLPRLVWRWKSLSEKIANGTVPTYDGYRSLVGVRTLIHNCIGHALPSSIERFRDDIFEADNTFLSGSTCFEDMLSKGAASHVLQEHWWLNCKPNKIPSNEMSSWPDLKIIKSASIVRYEPTSCSEQQEPQHADAITEKAQLLVQSGYLQRHSVGELKRAGLDADINQDNKIETEDELEILTDILADIFAGVGGENFRRSADGRECYLYRHKKNILVLVYDQIEGGTAFIPVLGERFFETWK